MQEMEHEYRGDEKQEHEEVELAGNLEKISFSFKLKHCCEIILNPLIFFVRKKDCYNFRTPMVSNVPFGTTFCFILFILHDIYIILNSYNLDNLNSFVLQRTVNVWVLLLS